MNGERQIKDGRSRRVRVKYRRSDREKGRRITPAFAATVLLLSALVGVAIGIGSGRLIRRIWEIRRDQARYAAERDVALSASPTPSARPSPSPAEGL